MATMTKTREEGLKEYVLFLKSTEDPEELTRSIAKDSFNEGLTLSIAKDGFNEGWLQCERAMKQDALWRHSVAAEWQPIETAPRDGTKFLVVTSSGSMKVDWLEPICARVHGYTHWMPLPAPPQKDAANVR